MCVSAKINVTEGRDGRDPSLAMIFLDCPPATGVDSLGLADHGQHDDGGRFKRSRAGIQA